MYPSCRLTHSLFPLAVLPGIEKVLLLLFFWWGRGTPLDHQARISASFPGAVANGILSFSLLRISWYLNRGWESIYLAVEPITYAKLIHTLLMTFKKLTERHNKNSENVQVLNMQLDDFVQAT